MPLLLTLVCTASGANAATGAGAGMPPAEEQPGQGAGCGCPAGRAPNPAFFDQIYHIHPAGMWMVSPQYMHVGQEDLGDGTSDVPTEKVSPLGSTPYGYMMTPTKMSMDMEMLMVMYGVSDRLTVMGMGSLQQNRMDMLMNMGMGNKPQEPMRTSGFGDTELGALYLLGGNLVGSVGVSLPTGSTTEETTMMKMVFRAPHDMQLGSGTIDFKPAITNAAASADGLWAWGGQAAFTWHTDENSKGYHLGDSLKITGWLQRALRPVSTSLRLAHSTTGKIHGQDEQIERILDPMMGAPTPDADPKNYGGQRLDGLAGLSLPLGRWSVGVEGGLPLYQNLNGLQLKTGWLASAGVRLMI